MQSVSPWKAQNWGAVVEPASDDEGVLKGEEGEEEGAIAVVSGSGMVDSAFGLLDVDGDGKVSRGDLRRAALNRDAVAAAKDLAPALAGLFCPRSYAAKWAELAEGSGGITLPRIKELAAGPAPEDADAGDEEGALGGSLSASGEEGAMAVFGSTAFVGAMAGPVERVFSLLDVNGDGKVSRGDLRRAALNRDAVAAAKDLAPALAGLFCPRSYAAKWAELAEGSGGITLPRIKELAAGPAPEDADAGAQDEEEAEAEGEEEGGEDEQEGVHRGTAGTVAGDGVEGYAGREGADAAVEATSDSGSVDQPGDYGGTTHADQNGAVTPSLDGAPVGEGNAAAIADTMADVTAEEAEGSVHEEALGIGRGESDEDRESVCVDQNTCASATGGAEADSDGPSNGAVARTMGGGDDPPNDRLEALGEGPIRETPSVGGNALLAAPTPASIEGGSMSPSGDAPEGGNATVALCEGTLPIGGQNGDIATAPTRTNEALMHFDLGPVAAECAESGGFGGFLVDDERRSHEISERVTASTLMHLTGSTHSCGVALSESALRASTVHQRLLQEGGIADSAGAAVLASVSLGAVGENDDNNQDDQDDGSVPHVVFVVGGPCCGKESICRRLASELGYTLVAVPFLVRSAVGSGSRLGRQILKAISAGGSVPATTVLGLVNKAIAGVHAKFEQFIADTPAGRQRARFETDAWRRANRPRFLVCGYPADLDQARAFEQLTGRPRPKWVLYLDCQPGTMVKRLVRQQRRNAGRGSKCKARHPGAARGDRDKGSEEESLANSFMMARQIVEDFQKQAVPLVNYYMTTVGVPVRTVSTDGHGTTWNDVYEEARLCCVAEDGAPIGEDDGDNSDADKWIDESDISDSDEDERTRQIRKLRKHRFVPPPGHEYGLGEELAAIKIQNLERGRRARRSTAILREERQRKAARRAAKVERRRQEAFARADARTAARQQAARAGARAVLEARRGVQTRGVADLSGSKSVERKVLTELERLKAVEARAATEAKAARRKRELKSEERVALMNEAFVQGVGQEDAEYRHQCRVLRGRPQEPMSRRLGPPRPPEHIISSSSTQPPRGGAKLRPHVPASNYSAPKRYTPRTRQGHASSRAAAASRKLLARDRAQQRRHQAERDPGTVVGALARWLESLKLYQRVSKHHVRWRRDLSSGFVVADILSRFYPSDVSLHTYSITSNTKCKEDNWRQLHMFFRKRRVPITADDVNTALKARDTEFAVNLLQRIYAHLAKRGLVPASAVLSAEENNAATAAVGSKPARVDVEPPPEMDIPMESNRVSALPAQIPQQRQPYVVPAALGGAQFITPFSRVPAMVPMMAPRDLMAPPAYVYAGMAAGFTPSAAGTIVPEFASAAGGTGGAARVNARGYAYAAPQLSPRVHANSQLNAMALAPGGGLLQQQQRQEYASANAYNMSSVSVQRGMRPPVQQRARLKNGGQPRNGPGGEVVTAGGRRLKGVAQQRGMFGGGNYDNFRVPRPPPQQQQQQLHRGDPHARYVTYG